MTTQVLYRCNGCGAQISQEQAAQFGGIWQNQSTVAAAGAHDWHSCGAECAAKYLRQVADAIEGRGRELAAKREAHQADQAKRLAEQVEFHERMARQIAEGAEKHRVAAESAAACAAQAAEAARRAAMPKR